MKKNYITPTMKVRKIQCSHILSGSNPNSVKFHEGQSVVEPTSEDAPYYGKDGYGIAW